MKNVLDKLDSKNIHLLRAIGELADAKKMHAYLVGGIVRDLALGGRALDLDVTVKGSGIQLAKAFAAARKGTVTTYPAFGTAAVKLPGGQAVDFATARKEVYVRPGAFPKVIYAGIEEDLFRRDFTINAMAVDVMPKSWGLLIDPHHGMKDLKGRCLRVLHTQSFIDDPTRILRAARFAGRLGFTLERGTAVLMAQALSGGALSTITPQRYAKEIRKINQEAHAKQAMRCLAEWGVQKPEGEVHVTH